MNKPDIYGLGLLGTLFLHDGTKVMRVPGGWIIQFTSGSAVYVPFSTEFLNKENR